MNIKHLEHLLAVAETESFSRAAHRLSITQSALSRSIQNLEEELGARLLDRIGKRNKPTPFGETVLARARRIVQDADELRRSATLFQQDGGGEIRVGLGSVPAALLMTPLLCHMASQQPRLHVSIVRGSTELQLMQLRARQLEALVIDARYVMPAPDLRIEQLAQLRACFICRAGHPLARQAVVTLPELRAFPVASGPLSGEVARLLTDLYGSQANPAQMVTLQCEDIASLLIAVEKTDAVFLGVAAAAREGLDSGRLIELRMSPAFQAVARFAYVALEGRTEAPAMAMFREFTVQRLRD